jgi:cytochrome c oxidase subunit II
MFSGPSNFVESVDTAFWVVMLISVVFLVIITVLMIYFVIKYDRKKHPKAVNIHGSVPLEIAWTLIPTGLVLIMFWYGWVGYKQISTIPEDGIKVQVTAQMWQWKFTYENGVEDDTLYVPINQDIILEMSSIDVNHSFFIPAFRVKRDVIPNRENRVWFNANEIGSFDIACAEYCGLNHWDMYTKVVVLPATNFELWLKNKEIEMQQAEETNDTAPPDTTNANLEN